MAKRGKRRETLSLDRALLIRLYDEQSLSVDKLPYTRNMDRIVEQYNARHLKAPVRHYETYQTLVILRKNSKLVRKNVTPTRGTLAELDRPLLIRLYHEQELAVDKLPYTDNIDRIVQQYNTRHMTAPASHYDAYQTLIILRKNCKLVRKDTSDQPTLF